MAGLRARYGYRRARVGDGRAGRRGHEAREMNRPSRIRRSESGDEAAHSLLRYRGLKSFVALRVKLHPYSSSSDTAISSLIKHAFERAEVRNSSGERDNCRERRCQATPLCRRRACGVRFERSVTSPPHPSAYSIVPSSLAPSLPAAYIREDAILSASSLQPSELAKGP